MNIFRTSFKDRILKYFMTVLISIFVLTFSFSTKSLAQANKQMVRLAKIKVDPSQLNNYNAALREQMTTAIRVEKGVLTYYAVADKTEPSNITILEIYADTAAYQLHITTPHFKKYKEAVKDIVKSLELVDVTLIGALKKPGM
jgi:quinol monooxygenase YgiN